MVRSINQYWEPGGGSIFRRAGFSVDRYNLPKTVIQIHRGIYR